MTHTSEFKKVVTWSDLAALSLALTKDLKRWVEGRQPEKDVVYMSSFPGGPYRDWSERPGLLPLEHTANSVGSWVMFREGAADFLVWESSVSGSRLEVWPSKLGGWELFFVPSRTDPEYRGKYWELFQALPQAPLGSWEFQKLLNEGNADNE